MDTTLWAALLGAVAGGALTFGAQALSDKWRWDRESAARWEGRLVDAILSYSADLKMQSRTALRMCGHYWPGMTPNPIDPEKGAELLAQYEDDRSARFEALLLMADASLVTAARKWQEAVWPLHLVAAGPSAATREEAEMAFRRAAEARDEYYVATRRTLNIAASEARTPIRLSPYDPTWQSQP